MWSPTRRRRTSRGKADPRFRTKRQIAAELVRRALAAAIPCRAVVAGSFYGEDEALRQEVRTRGLGYVLALQPGHCWWHLEGTIGSLQEAVEAAPWGGPEEPGAWGPVERAFRDGHRETWWVLEVEAGPYGPEKPQRGLVASTDPRTLPTLSTWHLVTNLPAPGSTQAAQSALAPAVAAELVRLYGLRPWVEQSYKQTKYALGWHEYQVRSDLAIRRHWALVCCAFTFCWYSASRQSPALAPLGGEMGSRPTPAAPPSPSPSASPSPAPSPSVPASLHEAGRGEKQRGAGTDAAPTLRAGGAAGGAGVAGAVDHAVALLARMVERAPASRAVPVA